MKAKNFLTTRCLETATLILAPSIFIVALALTIFFGDRALPVSRSVFHILTGSASVQDHVKVLRSCKLLICTEWMSEKVLSKSPHNTEALGASAISLCRRGRWKEAEPKFDQYFAGGGSATDVQKWYQKLLSQQASVDSDR